MNLYRSLLTVIILSFAVILNAKPILLSNKSTPPPRIIRTCCSFGSELNLAVVPVKKITNITSLEKIGSHHYLGNKAEGNGIIYTRLGGFIDLGHLRDQADWTAYLYSRISQNPQNAELKILLGHEGGAKELLLKIPANLNEKDKILLAGKIAYDLSVWHEIATWFGSSTIPMVPERYSSFSVEDIYSNLTGVNLGMQALQSDLPYEEAMTQLISNTLDDLKAVKAESDTYTAMEDVRNIWWTREKSLPSKKILIERQLKAYPTSKPMLVPGWTEVNEHSTDLNVPLTTTTGIALNNFYELRFDLNHKFPFKKMFPNRLERYVTQHDFDTLIAQVEQEIKKPNRLPKRIVALPQSKELITDRI